MSIKLIAVELKQSQIGKKTIKLFKVFDITLVKWMYDINAVNKHFEFSL